MKFCILASWFLSPMSKNSGLRGVKSKKISCHPKERSKERSEGERCLSQS